MRHQVDINDLHFAEQRFGKIVGWLPGAVDQKTGKINPQVSKLVREDGKFVSVFHVKPVYYETYTGAWRPLSEVTDWHGNHKMVFNSDWWKVHPRFLSWLEKRMKLINGELFIPSPFKTYPTPYVGIVRDLHRSLIPPKIGLTTTTVYPDPNVETTTVDGYVARDGQIETWATCYAAASGTGASDSATSSNCCYVADGVSPDYKWNYRAIYLFDASSIGDSDTINSSTFSIYVSSVYDENVGGTHDYSVLCSSNPASNTALATTDYDYNDFGTTEFSSQYAHTTSTPNAYADFTLNASGLAAISKTAVTKFALRTGYDITNTAPVSSAGAKTNGINGARWADETGTSMDPKLVVVHSAGGFVPSMATLGVGA